MHSLDQPQAVVSLREKSFFLAFISYLNFDGNCAEAMQFYAGLFHATEIQVMLYSDVPESERMPPSGRVIYSHIMVGETA